METNVKTVSNSEVIAFQKCERFHAFSWGLKLVPKDTSTSPMTLGTIGHRGLNAYYKSKINGFDNPEAVQAGMLELSKYMNGQFNEIMPIITKRFVAYATRHAHDPIEILAVEKSFRVQLSNNIDYVFTPDIIVTYTGGPFVGQTAVWDHKWSYNFWTDNEVHFDPQLPKYIWGLRQLGYDIDFGVINQLRTREIKEPRPEQLFKRSRTVPTAGRMENIMENQLTISERIAALPDSKVWFRKAEPSLSKMNCGQCFFQDPCNQMLEGNSCEDMLQINYMPNDTAPEYDKVG